MTTTPDQSVAEAAEDGTRVDEPEQGVPGGTGAGTGADEGDWPETDEALLDGYLPL